MTPALAPYLASLVVYDVDTGGAGVHRGLPTTTLTVVLALDEPLDVGWADEPAHRSTRWATASGLDSRPAAIHHGGVQRGVQLALTAAGARALLGCPAGALARQILDLGDVVPQLGDLPERLAGVGPTHRRAVVEQALTRVLAQQDPSPVRPEVAHAVALLERGAPVEAAAREVGYSRRHLGALVRAETGLTPKEHHRVGRFQRSRALLGRLPAAEVAVRCGYVDQSHLVREWVALAGCTPGTWLREELPFVQDSAPVGGAPSPA